MARTKQKFRKTPKAYSNKIKEKVVHRKESAKRKKVRKERHTVFKRKVLKKVATAHGYETDSRTDKQINAVVPIKLSEDLTPIIRTLILEDRTELTVEDVSIISASLLTVQTEDVIPREKTISYVNATVNLILHNLKDLRSTATDRLCAQKTEQLLCNRQFVKFAQPVYKIFQHYLISRITEVYFRNNAAILATASKEKAVTGTLFQLPTFYILVRRLSFRCPMRLMLSLRVSCDEYCKAQLVALLGAVLGTCIRNRRTCISLRDVEAVVASMQSEEEAQCPPLPPGGAVRLELHKKREELCCNRDVLLRATNSAVAKILAGLKAASSVVASLIDELISASFPLRNFYLEPRAKHYVEEFLKRRLEWFCYRALLQRGFEGIQEYSLSEIAKEDEDALSMLQSMGAFPKSKKSKKNKKIKKTVADIPTQADEWKSSNTDNTGKTGGVAHAEAAAIVTAAAVKDEDNAAAVSAASHSSVGKPLQSFTGTADDKKPQKSLTTSPAKDQEQGRHNALTFIDTAESKEEEEKEESGRKRKGSGEEEEYRSSSSENDGDESSSCDDSDSSDDDGDYSDVRLDPNHFILFMDSQKLQPNSASIASVRK